MPPPPRPRQVPSATKEDAALWKAYSVALKNKFFANLDTNTEAFYAAPIGAVKVPIGSKIHQEITNKAIAEIGDTLMDLKTPVYGTSSRSYIQRVHQLLGAVKLKGNPDMGAQKRLNDAKAKVYKLEMAFNEALVKAQEAYFSDEDKGNQTFKQWVPRNYPSFWSLEQERQAATNTEASLRAQVEGPGANEANRLKSKTTRATDVWTEFPGLNMYIAVVPGEIPKEMPDVSDETSRALKPEFNVASKLKDSVDDWNNGATSGGSNVSVSLTDSNSADWRSVGLPEVSANTEVAACTFFKVRHGGNHALREEIVTAQEAGSELKFTLTAADFGTFSISPGDWDVPNITEMYPQFTSSSETQFPAAARPSEILVGYKVGIEISLSENVAMRVKDLTAKTMSSRGSVSFFGYEINFENNSALGQSILDSSSGASITIPPKDLGYPVLLGVKGKKIPAVKINRG